MIELGWFFALACVVTWSLDATMVGSWIAGAQPPEWALGLAGLGAFGPTIAGALVAWRQGRAREMFRPWATSPLWVASAFASSWLMRQPTTAVLMALGQAPERWVLTPEKPEAWVALVMFSLGEEFGWRGFAQPRMIARFGPTLGPALLGVGWAAWHLPMMVTPAGVFDGMQFAVLLAMFPPASVLCARMMERGRGSLWIALAFHASGHIDNFGALPADQVAIRVGTLVTWWIVAFAVPVRPSARP